MKSKPLDAEVVTGVGIVGIMCFTKPARDFVNTHTKAVGQWHNDTFWMKLPLAMDLLDITTDMVKAGLLVD